MGVATLGADGKVPSAQLPANPGNFLPLAGGMMAGSVDMDEYNITTAGSVETGSVFTDEINSFSADIKVAKALDMENNKIVDVAKGTSTKDVATIDNINDHDTSPFAHADIRNLISAIQGTYIYVGTIGLATDDVDDTALNNRVFALLARTPLSGDVLVDNENGEWYFDGTNWKNLGHFDIALASALNDGLMTKEDFTKLNDLLNKGDFDNLISTLATMDYLVTNYYNKAMVDAIETSLQEDIDTKEALANKAIDFSVVNDTKYPTTKAVSERLLNLPIAELENQTLREVFELGNLVVNHDFTNNLVGWTVIGTITSSNVTNDILQFSTTTPGGYLSNLISVSAGDKIYYGGRAKTDNVSSFLLFQVDSNVSEIVITSNSFVNISSAYTVVNSTTNGRFYIRNVNGTTEIDYVFLINQTSLGISALTVKQMNYWFNVYQALLVSDTNAIFSMFASKTLEAWLTPTLTGATSTYIRYRKDTLGSVIVEGNITVGTAGTNLTLPTGYRPLFDYTVGNLTFNTDGTVVSSATGTQTLSIRFTGGA